MYEDVMDIPLSPADEAAVRALYQQMMDAWNHGSGEGFAAPFDDEAILSHSMART